jgi:hypothetical protein
MSGNQSSPINIEKEKRGVETLLKRAASLEVMDTATRT